MIDLPGLPPRTKVPLVEPIGVGESFIESLSGFVTRLAVELSVSVNNLCSELLGKVPNPYADTPLPGNQRKKGHVYIPHDYRMNGSHDQARKWVHAVESVTGRKNMHWHTLLPFGGAFVAGLRKRAAWCPACLEEARSKGKPAFEPLLWSLMEVTHCPIHCVRFSSQCRSCGHSFLPQQADHRSGYCGYCEAWLGCSGSDESEPDQSDRDGIWESTQVASVIALGVSIERDDALARLRSRLNMYIEVATGTDTRSFARLTGFRESNIRLWLKPDGVTPSVARLLRISKRLNVPLATFYSHEGPSSEELNCVQSVARDSGGSEPPLPKSTTTRELLLKAASGPPVSLQEVMRSLGINSVQSLYRVHGDLVKQITAKFAADGHRRPRDVDQLRVAMEKNVALDEPEPVERIALRQGYSRGYPQKKYPQLYAATIAKRAWVLAAWKARIARALELATQEHPPPSIRDMCRRLQIPDQGVFSRHEPELTNLIQSRHRAYRGGQPHELRLALERALRERPVVPPLKAIGRRLHISWQTLKRRLPDLAAQVVNQHRTTLKAENRLKYEFAFQRVKTAVEEVAALGMYPSYKHVAPRIPETVCKPGRTLEKIVKSARLGLGYVH
jgi:transcriptional regulator with XRE-family HTH domain